MFAATTTIRIAPATIKTIFQAFDMTSSQFSVFSFQFQFIPNRTENRERITTRIEAIRSDPDATLSLPDRGRRRSRPTGRREARRTPTREEFRRGAPQTLS